MPKNRISPRLLEAIYKKIKSRSDKTKPEVRFAAKLFLAINSLEENKLSDLQIGFTQTGSDIYAKIDEQVVFQAAEKALTSAINIFWPLQIQGTPVKNFNELRGLGQYHRKKILAESDITAYMPFLQGIATPFSREISTQSKEPNGNISIAKLEDQFAAIFPETKFGTSSSADTITPGDAMQEAMNNSSARGISASGNKKPSVTETVEQKIARVKTGKTIQELQQLKEKENKEKAEAERLAEEKVQQQNAELRAKLIEKNNAILKKQKIRINPESESSKTSETTSPVSSDNSSTNNNNINSPSRIYPGSNVSYPENPDTSESETETVSNIEPQTKNNINEPTSSSVISNSASPSPAEAAAIKNNNNINIENQNTQSDPVIISPEKGNTNSEKVTNSSNSSDDDIEEIELEDGAKPERIVNPNRTQAFVEIPPISDETKPDALYEPPKVTDIKPESQRLFEKKPLPVNSILSNEVENLFNKIHDRPFYNSVLREVNERVFEVKNSFLNLLNEQKNNLALITNEKPPKSEIYIEDMSNKAKKISEMSKEIEEIKHRLSIENPSSLTLSTAQNLTTTITKIQEKTRKNIFEMGKAIKTNLKSIKDEMENSNIINSLLLLKKSDIDANPYDYAAEKLLKKISQKDKAISDYLAKIKTEPPKEEDTIIYEYLTTVTADQLSKDREIASAYSTLNSYNKKISRFLESHSDTKEILNTEFEKIKALDSHITLDELTQIQNQPLELKSKGNAKKILELVFGSKAKEKFLLPLDIENKIKFIQSRSNTYRAYQSDSTLGPLINNTQAYIKKCLMTIEIDLKKDLINILNKNSLAVGVYTKGNNFNKKYVKERNDKFNDLIEQTLKDIKASDKKIEESLASKVDQKESADIESTSPRDIFKIISSLNAPLSELDLEDMSVIPEDSKDVNFINSEDNLQLGSIKAETKPEEKQEKKDNTEEKQSRVSIDKKLQQIKNYQTKIKQFESKLLDFQNNLGINQVISKNTEEEYINDSYRASAKVNLANLKDDFRELDINKPVLYFPPKAIPFITDQESKEIENFNHTFNHLQDLLNAAKLNDQANKIYFDLINNEDTLDIPALEIIKERTSSLQSGLLLITDKPCTEKLLEYITINNSIADYLTLKNKIQNINTNISEIFNDLTVNPRDLSEDKIADLDNKLNTVNLKITSLQNEIDKFQNPTYFNKAYKESLQQELNLINHDIIILRNKFIALQAKAEIVKEDKNSIELSEIKTNFIEELKPEAIFTQEELKLQTEEKKRIEIENKEQAQKEEAQPKIISAEQLLEDINLLVKNLQDYNQKGNDYINQEGKEDHSELYHSFLHLDKFKMLNQQYNNLINARNQFSKEKPDDTLFKEISSKIDSLFSLLKQGSFTQEISSINYKLEEKPVVSTNELNEYRSNLDNWLGKVNSANTREEISNDTQRELGKLYDKVQNKILGFEYKNLLNEIHNVSNDLMKLQHQFSIVDPTASGVNDAYTRYQRLQFLIEGTENPKSLLAQYNKVESSLLKPKSTHNLKALRENFSALFQLNHELYFESKLEDINNAIKNSPPGALSEDVTRDFTSVKYEFDTQVAKFNTGNVIKQNDITNSFSSLQRFTLDSISNINKLVSQIDYKIRNFNKEVDDFKIKLQQHSMALTELRNEVFEESKPEKLNIEFSTYNKIKTEFTTLKTNFNTLKEKYKHANNAVKQIINNIDSHELADLDQLYLETEKVIHFKFKVNELRDDFVGYIRSKEIFDFADKGILIEDIEVEEKYSEDKLAEPRPSKFILSHPVSGKFSFNNLHSRYESLRKQAELLNRKHPKIKTLFNSMLDEPLLMADLITKLDDINNEFDRSKKYTKENLNIFSERLEDINNQIDSFSKSKRFTDINQMYLNNMFEELSTKIANEQLDLWKKPAEDLTVIFNDFHLQLGSYAYNLGKKKTGLDDRFNKDAEAFYNQWSKQTHSQFAYLVQLRQSFEKYPHLNSHVDKLNNIISDLEQHLNFAKYGVELEKIWQKIIGTPPGALDEEKIKNEIAKILSEVKNIAGENSLLVPLSKVLRGGKANDPDNHFESLLISSDLLKNYVNNKNAMEKTELEEFLDKINNINDEMKNYNDENLISLRVDNSGINPRSSAASIENLNNNFSALAKEYHSKDTKYKNSKGEMLETINSIRNKFSELKGFHNYTNLLERLQNSFHILQRFYKNQNIYHLSDKHFDDKNIPKEYKPIHIKNFKFDDFNDAFKRDNKNNIKNIEELQKEIFKIDDKITDKTLGHNYLKDIINELYKRSNILLNHQRNTIPAIKKAIKDNKVAKAANLKIFDDALNYANEIANEEISKRADLDYLNLKNIHSILAKENLNIRDNLKEELIKQTINIGTLKTDATLAISNLNSYMSHLTNTVIPHLQSRSASYINSLNVDDPRRATLVALNSENEKISDITFHDLDKKLKGALRNAQQLQNKYNNILAEVIYLEPTLNDFDGTWKGKVRISADEVEVYKRGDMDDATFQQKINAGIISYGISAIDPIKEKAKLINMQSEMAKLTFNGRDYNNVNRENCNPDKAGKSADIYLNLSSSIIVTSGKDPRATQITIPHIREDLCVNSLIAKWIIEHDKAKFFNIDPTVDTTIQKRLLERLFLNYKESPPTEKGLKHYLLTLETAGAYKIPKGTPLKKDETMDIKVPELVKYCKTILRDTKKSPNHPSEQALELAAKMVESFISATTHEPDPRNPKELRKIPPERIIPPQLPYEGLMNPEIRYAIICYCLAMKKLLKSPEERKRYELIIPDAFIASKEISKFDKLLRSWDSQQQIYQSYRQRGLDYVAKTLDTKIKGISEKEIELNGSKNTEKIIDHKTRAKIINAPYENKEDTWFGIRNGKSKLEKHSEQFEKTGKKIQLLNTGPKYKLDEKKIQNEEKKPDIKRIR